MAEDSSSAAASSSSSEVQLTIKGPNQKFQVSISVDKNVAELKEAIAQADEKKDTPPDRQRLIYSGRVLKDEDELSKYKIQSGHTIHLVKGAARPAGSTSSGSTTNTAPQQLPSMQAGQSPTDPLTVLNGPMGHGIMAGFNPFADMGLNTNDPNMLSGALDNPLFMQQMSNMMSNPAIIDQIISMNPQLAGMGPQIRQMMQSDAFRSMMSNPQQLQAMMRMSQMMHEAGLGPGVGSPFSNPFGGMGAAAGSAFPAPGQPSHMQNQTPLANSTTAGTGDAAQPAAPGSPGAGAQPNPFAALSALLGNVGAAQQGQIPGQQPGSPGTGTGAAAAAGAGTANSPFGMVDPGLVQQLLGGMGGSGAGAPGFFGAPFGGGPAPPADTRSPEERFAPQLEQLQQMGFVNATQNIRALLATGGNVSAAIEYILNGGGL